MSDDLTSVFETLLARNLKRPDYGVHALLGAGGTRIDLVITFKNNAHYCCAEPGCHLGAYGPGFWVELRKGLTALGLPRPPFPLALHVEGVVEEGAILDVMGRIGLPAASLAIPFKLSWGMIAGAFLREIDCQNGMEVHVPLRGAEITEACRCHSTS